MKQRIWLILILLLAMSGCSKQDEQTPNIPAASRSAAVQPVAPVSDDFSSLDLCRLLPAQEVADVLAGKALKPAKRQDFGSSQSCEYELDPDGPDNYEYAAVWISPASSYDDSDATEQIEGLGDRAHRMIDSQEEQTSERVLVAGKATIEARAETAEHAHLLAKMALEKLSGRL